MIKKIAVITVLLSVALPCLATAAYQLPDTGQTACYQPSSPYGAISCGGTGQDGAYSINPMAFADQLDGTVSDSNTGLMWQQVDSGTHTWAQAAGVCGSLDLGGHNDWRLPTRRELFSLVNFAVSAPGPMIDQTKFPTASGAQYWATTDGAKAQTVDFAYGFFATYDDPPAGSYHVRCVRGAEPGNQMLVKAAADTVTDTDTGLMWQQTASQQLNWGDSLAYCRDLDFGGHVGDWRLPNAKELESWLDATRSNPAINAGYFPNAVQGVYWSSTTNPEYSDEVLCMDTNGNGVIGPYSKASGLTHYVQCVRSIPKASDGDLNGDGHVTVTDVLLALKAAVGLNTQTQFYLDHADIAPLDGNGAPTRNGTISVGDALLILQKAVGLVSW